MVSVLDLKTGARSVVSKPLPILKQNAAGSGFSSNPSISADGRFVAFESSSRGLVDEDHDHRPDRGYSPYQVYLRDLKARTTTLISRAPGAGGAIGDAESIHPVISANGRFVAFSSTAGNLLPAGSQHNQGVYVRDLATGAVKRASTWRGSSPRASASEPALSASGRYVAFRLQRSGDPASIVVRDLRKGTTVNASLLARIPLDVGFAGAPAISSDGRFVAFRAGPVVDGLQRLYLVDLRTRKTQLVHAVGTEEGGPLSFSAKGRFLLFDTYVEATVPKGPTPFAPASGRVYRWANPWADKTMARP
jgi:TolB protein